MKKYFYNLTKLFEKTGLIPAHIGPVILTMAIAQGIAVAIAPGLSFILATGVIYGIFAIAKERDRLARNCHMLKGLCSCILSVVLFSLGHSAAAGVVTALSFIWLIGSPVSPRELILRTRDQLSRYYVNKAKSDEVNALLSDPQFLNSATSEADAVLQVNKILSSKLDPYTTLSQRGGLNEWTQQCEASDSCVFWQVLEHNIGLIQVTNFVSETFVTEFPKALESLSACQSLILDLRWNRGGLLDYAIIMLQCLLDEGVLLSMFTHLLQKDRFTEYSLKKENMKITTTNAKGELIKCGTEPRQPNLWGKRPLVVLVNDSTASVAEVVTACLQDNKRALVIGTRTYGKGIGQDIVTYANGTVLFATSTMFFTPNAENIGDGTDGDDQGITPDHVVSEEDVLFVGPNNTHDAEVRFAIEHLHKQFRSVLS